MSEQELRFVKFVCPRYDCKLYAVPVDRREDANDNCPECDAQLMKLAPVRHSKTSQI